MLAIVMVKVWWLCCGSGVVVGVMRVVMIIGRLPGEGAISINFKVFFFFLLDQG